MIMLLVAVGEGIDVGVVEETLGAVTPWETLMYVWRREKDCLTNNMNTFFFFIVTQKCSQKSPSFICIRHEISFQTDHKIILYKYFNFFFAITLLYCKMKIQKIRIFNNK